MTELSPTTGPAARPEHVERFTAELARGMAGGVLSFPLTAFGADGAPALDGYRTHVACQLAAEPGALFVCCGTGEFFSLDEDEYASCVRTAVEEANGRVPVVAGAGYGWPQAARFCAAAEKAGADGILLMPPYLIDAPQDGIVRHVHEIAARTGLPLIVYQRAGVNLGVPQVERLAQLPTVVGLKDAHGKMERVVQQRLAAPREWLFFNGTPTAELQAAAYQAIGVPAYSSAVHAFAPEIAKTFFAALQADESETTDELLREFYAPLVRLRDRAEGYAVSLVKAAARHRGQPVGPVRAPLVDPADDDVAELEKLLAHGLRIAGAGGGSA